MIPVYQTKFGEDPIAPGNCFQACLASIFECRIEDFPDEADVIRQLAGSDPKWGRYPQYARRNKSWERVWELTQRQLLAERDLWMIEVDRAPDFADGWCVITARSPRGLNHACVGYGSAIIHDPHPDGGGITENGRTYLYFVARYPRIAR